MFVSDSSAGTSYGQLIADQLAEERARKSALESRGITVISVSGVLCTLILGLTAGVTTSTGFRFVAFVRVPLVLALVAFVSAAACGLLTNLPLRYKEPTARALVGLLNVRYWTGPEEIGELRVAEAQVTILSAARTANGLKARLLLAAVLFELLAVAFLSCAAAVLVCGG
jgi:hypothetical protein